MTSTRPSMGGDGGRPAPGEYVLEGLAVPESLERLHALLERAAGEERLADEDVMMFETAVIELAGNAVEHGRPPGAVRYRFALTVHPDLLDATLREVNEAVPADPETAALPEGLAEGGRGLALARACLDELGYERVGGENVWRLVRRRR